LWIVSQWLLHFGGTDFRSLSQVVLRQKTDEYIGIKYDYPDVIAKHGSAS